MTREEAIKRLKEARNTIQPFRYVDEAIDYAIKALEQEPCDDAVSRQKELIESLQTANATNTTLIKLLESKQEPCDDCVSRQALLDEFKDGTEGYDWAKWTRIDIIDAIEALPSVFPKREQGEWIRKECDLGVYFRCSKCHKLAPNYDCDYKEGAITTKYCPNCGAEMR